MISRRDLLKQMGVAGAVAVGPLAPAVAAAQQRSAAAAPAAFEVLSPSEAEVLEAAVARIIPSDESGPGAKEAGAAHYIDRALAGPLASSHPAYRSSLAALDAYARTSKGAAFAALSGSDQDAVLADVESNKATGFTPSGSGFFGMLRSHTIEGTFSDPYYGGNANFTGWDLIGYPGVRVSVAPAEQQLGASVAPNHKSAYDFGMFRK
jgi:gluconate 2-dehydrogenase gamma chain